MSLENVEWVDPSTLQLNPENTNRHPEEQVEMLAQQIKYQGWRHPLVVRKSDRMIAAGEGRFLAAQKLGEKKIPVSFQDFQSQEQFDAFVTADNASADWAELDLAKLDEISAKMPEDFDISLFGLRNYEPSTEDMVEKVNKGSENDEWVGMPEFKEGGKYIKLIYHFESEVDREKFIEENNIKVDMFQNGQCIVYA